MKTCFKCGESKILLEFYRHSRMGDGHLGKCKECCKKDVRENRQKRADYYREYDKHRYKHDPRHRKLVYESSARYEIKQPHKRKANVMVNNAVRDGRLVKQPCEVCNDPCTHGHHDDYDKPLEVRWLCPVHHSEVHRKKLKS